MRIGQYGMAIQGIIFDEIGEAGGGVVCRHVPDGGEGRPGIAGSIEMLLDICK